MERVQSLNKSQKRVVANKGKGNRGDQNVKFDQGTRLKDAYEGLET